MTAENYASIIDISLKNQSKWHTYGPMGNDKMLKYVLYNVRNILCKN